jgi:hypothetical protein
MQSNTEQPITNAIAQVVEQPAAEARTPGPVDIFAAGGVVFFAAVFFLWFFFEHLETQRLLADMRRRAEARRVQNTLMSADLLITIAEQERARLARVRAENIAAAEKAAAAAASVEALKDVAQSSKRRRIFKLY